MMQNSEKIYEKLVKDRLNKKQMDILDIVGVFCVFIMSRTYIKSNAEVGEFIQDVLKEKFPGYVIKSRTLMAARVCKILLNGETLDVIKIQTKLREVLKNGESSLKKDDDRKGTKKTRKENENTKLEKWLKGFGNAE